MGIDGSDIKKYTEHQAIAADRFTGSSIRIDCQACKLEAGMMAEVIPRFTPFIRFIGYLIAIPSFVGMFLSSVAAGMAFGGYELTFAYGLFGAVVLFCWSAISGLVGWLLLMKKSVYRCGRCGYIIDRA